MADTPGGAVASFVASTTALIQSIGVNAHIDSGQFPWMNATLLQDEMQYLGITHIRDGTPYSWALPVYERLASAGIKFDLQQENPTSAPLTTIGAREDVERAAALVAAIPGSVESMEGANEYNLWHISLNGVDSYNNLAWGVLDAQNLQSAVRAAPVLEGVLVVAPAAALVSAVPAMASYVDASNWHVYGGVGQQLAGAMALGVRNAEATAPGKPVFITEAGISSSGYGSSFWGVADERTQAIIDLNAVLDAFHAGVFRTFLYELMEEPDKGGQEGAFGLFSSDGTAKPVATAIHNMVAILSNGGPAAAGTGAIGYSLSGLPSTASAMLLQQPGGLFDLVVWNGQALVSDGTQDLQPAPAQVHLGLASGQASFKVYDPIAGTAPLTETGVTDGTTFALSADPVIISISPATLGRTVDAPPGALLPSIDPALHGAFAITDPSTGLAGGNPGTAYAGPVAFLQRQFIWTGAQGVAVVANTPNAFLHGGAGDDGLRVTAGSNVLDGGSGSNFLVGSPGADGGTDTFFVDGRIAGSASIWSTLVNFHAGDRATIWGLAEAAGAPAWIGVSGADAFTGATLHANVSGHDVSVTFAGLSMADARSQLVSEFGQIDGQSYAVITRMS